MSNLSKDYDRIISEIEKTISNEQEREIVKQKIADLSILFFNLIENMNSIVEEKLVRIEEKQNDIDERIENLKKSVDEIEGDIYEESGEYDFEIVCPYCSNEFVTNLELIDDEKSEIRCPECNNIIELDWNDEEDDEGCSGHCSSCHGCGDEDYLEYEDENDEEDDM